MLTFPIIRVDSCYSWFPLLHAVNGYTIFYGVLETTVGLVDLAMVRSFGAEATAAVGVSRQIGIFVEGFAVAISTGAIALVSRQVGAGRAGEVSRVVRQSFRLVLLLGLPVTFAGCLVSGPLLRALSAIVQAHRNGYFYCLNREDGKFSYGKPFCEINWTDRSKGDEGLDPETGRPFVSPDAMPTDEGVRVCPGVSVHRPLRAPLPATLPV